MGREVRRVPADWKHPRNDLGMFIPMYGRFPFEPDEVKDGLREGWMTGEPPHYGIPVMPNWPAAERTHFQMYETTSEGTPLSPPMPSLEELARWLADNGANAFAGQIATYEQWLAMGRAGSAPTIAAIGGFMMSGVAYVADATRKKHT